MLFTLQGLNFCEKKTNKYAPPEIMSTLCGGAVISPIHHCSEVTLQNESVEIVKTTFS